MLKRRFAWFALLWITLFNVLASPVESSPLRAKKFTVCIDPIHSQEISADAKLSETKVSWQIAQRLQIALQKEGMRVLMTKQSVSQNLSNVERTEIANSAKADVFLRVRCSSTNESGIATFYPAKAVLVGNIKRPSAEVLAVSLEAATLFHETLIQSLGPTFDDRGLHARTKKQGNATSAIFSKTPVIVVELGDINDSKDARILETVRGQATFTKAITFGLQAVQRNLKTSLNNDSSQENPEEPTQGGILRDDASNPPTETPSPSQDKPKLRSHLKKDKYLNKNKIKTFDGVDTSASRGEVGIPVARIFDPKRQQESIPGSRQVPVIIRHSPRAKATLVAPTQTQRGVTRTIKPIPGDCGCRQCPIATPLSSRTTPPKKRASIIPHTQVSRL